MMPFLSRLWVFARPFKGRLALGIICGLCFALFNGALLGVIQLVIDLVFGSSDHVTIADRLKGGPAFIQPVVQRLVGHLPSLHTPDSRTGILLVISIIPITMFLRGLFDYLNVYFTNWAAVRTVASIRTRLFEHLQNLPTSFFAGSSTGELISRVTNDTQVLYNIIGSSFASLVKDPFVIIITALVLLTQQPELTIVSMAVLPICLVPMIIYGKKVRKSARAMQGHISQLSSLMHESFTANRIIKAYNLEAAVTDQFRKTTDKYIGQIMRVVRANEIPSQLTEFLGAVGIALVLAYVVFHTGGSRPPGGFVTFVLGIVVVYKPIKSLTRLHNQLNQASSASQRVFELLESVNTVIEPANPLPLKANGADIYFEDVDFNYGEKAVLRGINLTIKAGQMVALVGRSGSGKTTLTNLLLRFYDPVHGSIRIGQADLRQLAIKDLRHQIALVTQETILFNDTIARNIAIGLPGASPAQIEAAARHAFAHDFIMEKEQGYETVVGEKGVSLSGGQRQRIAIARAILKDAPILVLDEATSALDTESERAVQAALEKLMEGRTTICIAHRLSTVQRADVIAVMEQGKIAEIGSHADLVQHGGIYSRLHELQFDGVPLQA
jgi:subfamily B ATP-binding cassette protein MsbA